MLEALKRITEAIDAGEKKLQELESATEAVCVPLQNSSVAASSPLVAKTTPPKIPRTTTVDAPERADAVQNLIPESKKRTRGQMMKGMGKKQTMQALMTKPPRLAAWTGLNEPTAPVIADVSPEANAAMQSRTATPLPPLGMSLSLIHI